MALWTRLSGAQRLAVTAYIAAFVTLVIGSLLMDSPGVDAAWWPLMSVLAVAVPAGAIAIAWWLTSDRDLTHAASDEPGGRRPGAPSQPLALGLGTAMVITGRVFDRHVGSALSVALMTWWFVAIVVLFFVVPRLRTRA